MNKKKHLSVLIIKDEKKEPINIKLSYKLLYSIFLIIFTIVIIFSLAMLYYYRFYRLHSDYNEILTENLKLKEERSRVARIFVEYKKMREVYLRLRHLLGSSMGTQEKDVGNLENDMDISSVSYENNFSNSSDFLERLKIVKIDNISNIPSLFPVSDGYITKEFKAKAQPPLQKHTGIDIVSKEGAVIRAPADGVVVFSGWNYKYGNMIIIDHLNGFMTFYKHNKSSMVEEGSYVKKGTSIALLGNSGMSSGPHLHFEVWRNGVPLNPTLLVGE